MKEDMHTPDNGNTTNPHESVPTLVNLPNGRQAVVGRGLVKKFGRGQYGPKPTSQEAIEIAFRNFPDGTRLRLISDPNDPTRTMFAVWRDGSVKLLEKFEYGHDVFVPPTRNDQLIRSITLPRGVQSCGKPGDMARGVGELVSEVVPLNKFEQILFGAFPVLTWAWEGLPFPPTVEIRGPRDIAIPLLQGLSLFCRYGLVIADATPAGLIQTCSRISPTLLFADFGLRRDLVR